MSKSKYTEELKLKVIHYVQEGHSMYQAAKEFYVEKGTVQKWINAYRIHGVNSICIRQHNHNKYTGDFKVHEIEYKRNKQLSARQTAAHFNISCSTYYYYVRQLEKPDKYGMIKDEIIAIYHENQGRYGYRRITQELHNINYYINHKAVQHFMKELHLKYMVRVKKYRSCKGKIGKIAPNLLQRNFKAGKPNQKWTTDITEFAMFGKKIYLSPKYELNFSFRSRLAVSTQTIPRTFEGKRNSAEYVSKRKLFR